ncbi:anaphase-promoting complex, subunit, putative [Ixodes scapularis]|uniref:Anaphase-promoting complex subunit 10 n=1 Tax=Ixodes scapularis TaxID=6945 RepID=B7Q486_IXOSC|nr:anaphase-promoting complex, subunit, putative [Ixodes scapularis]|eukprot:XP_002399965.1 anaphase-promoting complex, subunit, putative [Ixodes scapularis]
MLQDAQDVFNLENHGRVREVGSQAVWSVSSGRRGHGVSQLRDGDLDTFWQSDGELPHRIDVQFGRRLSIQAVLINVCHDLDENFTPNVVSVSAGNDPHDMRTVGGVSMTRPSGWVLIETEDSEERPPRAFCLRLYVHINHQFGMDSRVRQMKVYTPAQETVVSTLPEEVTFSSLECRMFSRIR